LAKIVLNKENLFHNLNIISNHAGGKEKVAVVLKDNAYGHGLLEIALLAKEFGIQKAVVRTLDEALLIEKHFDDILILAQKDIPTYSHAFHIALNSLEDMENLPLYAKVHIKVDTGMHRNGIDKNDLREAIIGLIEKKITISGVFTHHKSADNLSTYFYWQSSIFRYLQEEVKNICEELSITVPLFHSCNSAALFRHENFDEAFARVGIAAYGYIENDSIFNLPDLKPVLSLWASRQTSRVLKKGECVGYGGTYEAQEDIEVSTYDVGYGDGFLRLNEKQEYTTPKGFKILGRVSMDNMTLDSTDDEVCLFEDVRELAKLQDTITYEIITTLSREIPRVIK
jgi:alanine racemase